MLHVSTLHFLVFYYQVVFYGINALQFYYYFLNYLQIEKRMGSFQLWVLWMKLLWTFMYKLLYENKSSSLLDKHPRVQLLGQIISSFLIYKATTKTFSRYFVVLFYIPTHNVWVIQFLHIFTSVTCILKSWTEKSVNVF